MADDVQSLLQKGISAMRSGRREDAREYFVQATDQDERNEQAWFLLSEVVDDKEDIIVCLENVLAVNPDHKQAQQRLAETQGLAAPSAPSAPTPQGQTK